MKQDYYDKISKGYDELYEKEQLKKLEVISRLLKKNNILLNNKTTLLDVGCGTGISTSYFKCDSIGIDPSKELIKIAKEKRKINCVVAFAENIPYKTNSFDIVLSLTAIQNFNSIIKGLNEIKRVGKKYFILTFLKKTKKREIIEKAIKNNFQIIKKTEEDKDIIYILSKN